MWHNHIHKAECPTKRKQKWHPSPPIHSIPHLPSHRKTNHIWIIFAQVVILKSSFCSSLLSILTKFLFQYSCSILNQPVLNMSFPFIITENHAIFSQIVHHLTYKHLSDPNFWQQPVIDTPLPGSPLENVTIVNEPCFITGWTCFKLSHLSPWFLKTGFNSRLVFPYGRKGNPSPFSNLHTVVINPAFNILVQTLPTHFYKTDFP